jgi:hypothetical protein
VLGGVADNSANRATKAADERSPATGTGVAAALDPPIWIGRGSEVRALLPMGGPTE